MWYMASTDLNRARTAQLGRRWGCRLSVGQCFECWCRRIAAIAISYQKQQQPAAQVKLHCTARASQLNNSNPPQGPPNLVLYSFCQK